MALSRFYFLLKHFTSHADSDISKGAVLLLLGLSWEMGCSPTLGETNLWHMMGIHCVYLRERCQGSG